MPRDWSNWKILLLSLGGWNGFWKEERRRRSKKGISSVVRAQLLSHVWLFATPGTIAQSHWDFPGSPVDGIFQVRVVEWAAIASCRGSSRPRGQTCISCIGGKFFTTEPPGKPRAFQERLPNILKICLKNKYIILLIYGKESSQIKKR